MFPQIACPKGRIFTLVAFVRRLFIIKAIFATISIHNFDVSSFAASVQLTYKEDICLKIVKGIHFLGAFQDPPPFLKMPIFSLVLLSFDSIFKLSNPQGSWQGQNPLPFLAMPVFSDHLLQPPFPNTLESYTQFPG